MAPRTPRRRRAAALPIVVRRGNAWSACSLGFKLLLSKRADCRSPANGGIHAHGGVAVELDDDRRLDVVRLLPPPVESTVTRRRRQDLSCVEMRRTSGSSSASRSLAPRDDSAGRPPLGNCGVASRRSSVSSRRLVWSTQFLDRQRSRRHGRPDYRDRGEAAVTAPRPRVLRFVPIGAVGVSWNPASTRLLLARKSRASDRSVIALWQPPRRLVSQAARKEGRRPSNGRDLIGHPGVCLDRRRGGPEYLAPCGGPKQTRPLPAVVRCYAGLTGRGTSTTCWCATRPAGELLAASSRMTRRGCGALCRALLRLKVEVVATRAAGWAVGRAAVGRGAAGAAHASQAGRGVPGAVSCRGGQI